MSKLQSTLQVSKRFFQFEKTFKSVQMGKGFSELWKGSKRQFSRLPKFYFAK